MLRRGKRSSTPEKSKTQRAFHFVAERHRLDVAIDRLDLAAHHAQRLAFGAKPRNRMQADRSAKVLGCGPERIIKRVGVGLIRGRRGPNQRALMPDVVAAAQLAHSRIDVVERDERQTDQAPGRIRAVLRQPIAIGAEASALQRSIAYPKLAEAEGGIDNLGLDSVEIHILETLGGIPSAAPRVFVGRGSKEGGELFGLLTGTQSLAQMDGRKAFEDQV